jgi:hypothetical protein
MRTSRTVLFGIGLVLAGCTVAPKQACTPPSGHWQKPHNLVGLMPAMNYLAITHDGALHWNGKPISSARLSEYLRLSHHLNPEPTVFLETEMGTPCHALDAVRKKMDEALECKKSGRCAEGIERVWRELPTPAGRPIS